MTMDWGDNTDDILGEPQGEADVVCPWCGEPVLLVLDPWGGSPQSYVEDCEVCCRPWSIQVRWTRKGRARVQVDAVDG